MTRAYQEIYLSKAQSVMGDAFDYAVNTCNILGTDFVKLFIASSVSKRMEMVNLLILQVKAALKSFERSLQRQKGKNCK